MNGITKFIEVIKEKTVFVDPNTVFLDTDILFYPIIKSSSVKC